MLTPSQMFEVFVLFHLVSALVPPLVLWVVWRRGRFTLMDFLNLVLLAALVLILTRDGFRFLLHLPIRGLLRFLSHFIVTLSVVFLVSLAVSIFVYVVLRKRRRFPETLTAPSGKSDEAGL